MKKNVASQVVGAQLNSKTDGSNVTSGTTTVYVLGDGGTQGTGSVGSGAATHEGHGFWTYAPAQAETNYDHVAFTFENSSAVTATVQIYTSFPQTGDNYARLGAPAGASVSADVAAVKAVLPAALVSGRIDASVGAIAAGAITATSIAADAITDAKVAADVTIASVTGAVGSVTGAVGSVTGNVGGNVTGTVASVVGAVGSVTGNVGGNVTGSVGSIATGGIAAASFVAGAIDATAIATDAFGALEVAAGAASEIATAVRTELATELARVDATISSRLAGAAYSATPTVQQIVDGVLDEAIASHQDAGSVGEAITDAGAGGNPWSTALDGVITAGEILVIAGSVLAGKTDIVPTGTDAATVTFRDLSDTKDVVTAQMQGSERATVTLDP